MIKVLRVDDRLLHGQVAVAWTNYYKIDTIVVANDKLITDATMQMAFKLATPPEVTLSMKSLDGAVAVINNPKHAARTIMVICMNSYMDADDIAVMDSMEKKGAELVMQADPTSKRLTTADIRKSFAR